MLWAVIPSTLVRPVRRLLIGWALASLGMVACTSNSPSTNRDGSPDEKAAAGGTGGASQPRGSGGEQSTGGAGTGGVIATGGRGGSGGVVAAGGTLVNSGSGGGGSPDVGGNNGGTISAGGTGGSGVLDAASDRVLGFEVFDGVSEGGLGLDVSDGASDRALGFDTIASSAVDAGAEGPRVAAFDTQANGCGLLNANDLIADFATDSSLYPVDGRSGAFYVFGDGLGTFDPPQMSNRDYPVDRMTGNPSCSGPGSFHVKATGFTNWGATVAADFVAKPYGGAYSATYDASKYKGVSFWAKGAAAIANVLVSFPDVYTDGGANPTAIDPTAQPCVYAPSSTVGCSPYLVKFADPTFSSYLDYQIDTSWKRFDILFRDTLQDRYNPGYHTSADRLDVYHLTRLEIRVGVTYVSGLPIANDFEMWIDDVRFIE